MMTVNGREFCNLASRIHNNNLTKEEICNRCSVNRAYYGAYHIAAKYLGISTTAEDTTHSDVIRKLEDEIPYLGEMLSSLFDDRWDADYDLFTRITKSDAEKAIKTANTIENSEKPHLNS